MDDQRGYTPEEIERGDDRASHIPLWGCVLAVLAVSLVAYGLYRFAIWLGFAWSFGS